MMCGVHMQSFMTISSGITVILGMLRACIISSTDGTDFLKRRDGLR
jgi:hypothetical protein